ncbi:hypothetical protein SAMN05216326_13218 [Nitrosomonas marina]|uniref:IraD/Gp25-like domain-containing protein n=1 Tax=Nitrosomonas marina TaxID=917 RepID=A0A1I0F144_9PROT|nr:GPW/gp25 family protein [Nitrosomonas marina]SET51717.1 hypothetical protein SAMN05216326_13218 [Nitrosomonas marina]
MLQEKRSFAFPMNVNHVGRITSRGGNEAIRNKIIQVLFTAPGERVNQPEFGCGLFNLVFEPNSTVLSAAMQFTIGQALSRWLGDEIITNSVSINPDNNFINIEILYTNKEDLQQQATRIQFK